MKLYAFCLSIIFFTLRSAAQSPSGTEVCPEKFEAASAVNSEITECGDSIFTLPTVSEEEGITDATDTTPGYTPRNQLPDWWINRIRSRNYQISDTTIIYPRFIGFCVKVYNWADHTFNSYDNEYVQPTGKKWKVMWKSSNWADSYALDMPDNIHIRMLSNIYMSTGPYISFMAVTIGYGANLNQLLFKSHPRQQRYDFSFSTALFEVDLYYTENKDGTFIRRFQPYDQGRYIKINFPSLQFQNYGAAAFYFFNHGRYYQGAAYNYSKIQKKTQGSWILGLGLSHQDIAFDLATLPDDMRLYLPPAEKTKFRFVYNDYCIVAGCGYNCVFNPHWVFNITGLPTFGLRHCTEDNGDGRKYLPAINLMGRAGMAYNLHNFFAGIYASAQANWYINKDYSFVNAVLSAGLAAGLRF